MRYGVFPDLTHSRYPKLEILCDIQNAVQLEEKVNSLPLGYASVLLLELRNKRESLSDSMELGRLLDRRRRNDRVLALYIFGALVFGGSLIGVFILT